MSITTNNWAARTIKGGRVLICGVWYEPDYRDGSVPYDGRLDGKRMMFGRYIDLFCPDGTVIHMPLVCLWGSERDWKTHDCEQWQDYPGDNCIDNQINWMWWVPVSGEKG